MIDMNTELCRILVCHEFTAISKVGREARAFENLLVNVKKLKSADLEDETDKSQKPLAP